MTLFLLSVSTYPTLFTLSLSSFLFLALSLSLSLSLSFSLLPILLLSLYLNPSFLYLTPSMSPSHSPPFFPRPYLTDQTSPTPSPMFLYFPYYSKLFQCLSLIAQSVNASLTSSTRVIRRVVLFQILTCDMNNYKTLPYPILCLY